VSQPSASGSVVVDDALARPVGAIGSVSGAMGSVSVETIADEERMLALRGEWTALLGRSDADGVFLTWEWLSTWWRHLGRGRRLHLVAVRERRELIALAPLAATPGRRASLAPLSSLAFLGSGSVGSDYLDVIVARGREAEALDGLAAGLDRQTLSLVLGQLDRGTSAARELARRLGRRGWRCTERATDVCPFIPLAGLTWDSYLASVSGHHRSNVRRRLANLHRAFDVRFEPVATEAERTLALVLFLDLHARRWQGRGGSSAFYSSELRQFHDAWTTIALARGWLRLFLMHLDGKPVGALYAYRYRHTFGFYQIGFDPEYGRHGIGQVMVGLAIARAIDEGAAEFDFLHGDEPYKFDWTRRVRELGRVDAYPPSVRGRVHRGLQAVDGHARRLVRHALTAGRAASGSART